MTSATYTFGTPSSPTTALWRRLNRREAPVENIGALMELPQYGGKGRKAEKVMPIPTVLVNRGGLRMDRGRQYAQSASAEGEDFRFELAQSAPWLAGNLLFHNVRTIRRGLRHRLDLPRLIERSAGVTVFHRDELLAWRDAQPRLGGAQP